MCPINAGLIPSYSVFLQYTMLDGQDQVGSVFVDGEVCLFLYLWMHVHACIIYSLPGENIVLTAIRVIFEYIRFIAN